VNARRPSARYMTPWSAVLMVKLLHLLPTRVTDALLRAVMGLTPKKLAARPTVAALEASA